MNDSNTPAIAHANNPCATYSNIKGMANPSGPTALPTIGVAMNAAMSNPRTNTILTLLVLNQNPKKMKKNMMPQSNVGVTPVATYPGKMFGAMLSNAKCLAVRFLYAAPNVGVGRVVIAGMVKVCSTGSHPVESQAL